MNTLNPDLGRTAHDGLHSEDEMQDIVASTTGRRAQTTEVQDKQLDDLMYFIFSDILDQEDSYDY